MRTKEAEDREQQESTWIFLLHQQAPPASRSLPPAAALFPPAPPHLNRLSVFQRPTHQPHGPLVANPLRLGPLEPNPLREPALYALKTQQTAVGAARLPRFPAPEQQRPRLEHRPAAELAGASEALERYAGRAQDAAAPAALLELLPQKRRRAEDEDADVKQEPEDAATPRSKRNCFPKKCDFPMCKNSSRSRGFCYSHGGGRRCSVDGCANGAVSRDLCKRHGGGRRCKVAGCKSSSESGGLCYSHGGGRRCSLEGCSARAKKGGLCALHLSDPSADRVAPAKPATPASPDDVVTHTNAVETLLALARTQRAAQDEAGAAPPSSGLAIASILN